MQPYFYLHGIRSKPFLLIMPTATSHGFSAPYYGIPVVSMVSVEHPCIVKSGLQAAVDTLGGLKELQKVRNVPFRTSRPSLTEKKTSYLKLHRTDAMQN